MSKEKSMNRTIWNEALVMGKRSTKRSAASFFTLVFAIALAYGALDPTLTKAAAPPASTKLGKSALKGNTGANNTAIGFYTLNPNYFCTGAGTPNPCCTGANKGVCGNSGMNNTAVGAGALTSNTTGNSNTAIGEVSLLLNTTGNQNSALGELALASNTTGNGNVAVGYQALAAGSADHNVAVGYAALRNNTTGAANTGLGDFALFTNTTGNGSTAVGSQALLFSNNNDNTAVGTACLRNTTTGFNNTGLGRATLVANTTGMGNTGLGVNALFNNTTGTGNIAVGQFAGFNLTTGNSNIVIGNNGVAAESDTIRIGAAQTATYIAGISGATSAGGVAVFVDGAGHLGTITSSARFKEDIQDIGDSSSALMKLRPVRFHYKRDVDPSGVEQYGLVAEEVAKVYPDLVVYDENGQPQTVRYHFVNALLLNEVQRQARQAEAQQREIEAQRRAIEAQQRENAALAAEVRRMSTEARQIDSLTARLVELEKALGAGAEARQVLVRAESSPG
jgi:hypothetical protein